MDATDNQEGKKGFCCPITGMTPPECKAKCEETLKSLWGGSVPLCEAFWFYLCGGVVLLDVLARFLPLLGGVLNVLVLAWVIFMARPLMQAADKYAGDKRHGRTALIAAVVIGVSALMPLVYG